MITIVDYGLGNVQAISNIYNRLRVPVKRARTADDLIDAERLILPGVGAFDWAMTRLEQSGMRSVLDELVLRKRRPVLGICVGMQMLADRSEEGILSGLGWIGGEVKRFDESRIKEPTHLPHMGWNSVAPRSMGCLFGDLGSEANFYFLHSYYFAPTHESDILAETDYHGNYASSVRRENIFGVQFHPEKSHRWGIRLLQNFAALKR